MQKVIQTSQLRIFAGEGDGSTFSQEASPASRFLSPASAEVRRTAVTSGLTCSVPFTRSGPIGLLVRTLVASSRWYSPARRLTWDISPLFSERLSLYTANGRNTSWRPSAEILSVRDIPSSRFLFQLAVSERRTGGTGYGLLLPTVQTQGLKVCDKNGKTKFMDVSLLPTPTAQDFKRRGPNSKQQGLPEAAYKKILPTPTARSYKHGSKITDGRSRRKISQGWTMELNDLAVSGLLPNPTRRDDALCNIPVMIGQHCQQNDGKTSQLNPLFVEEMMGYPLMWTTLPFLSQNGDKNP